MNQGKNPKRQSTAVRKVQIKEAVLNIIVNQGLDKLSTSNLAKTVGISEGTIFRHYSSKNEIILDILDDVRSNLLSKMESVVKSNEPARNRLRKLFYTHISYLLKNKGITILLFAEVAHMNDTILKDNLNDILNTQMSYIQSIIKDGIDEGIWTDQYSLDDISTLYLGMPVMMNIRITLSKGKLPEDDFCDRMLPLFEKILKK